MEQKQKERLNELGFVTASTGGGCTAFVDSEWQYQITSQEHECIAPDDFENEPIYVGAWDGGGDSPVIGYDSLRSFLQAYSDYRDKGGTDTFKSFMDRPAKDPKKFVYVVEPYQYGETTGVYDSIEVVRTVFDSMLLYEDGYGQWKLFDVENRDDLDGDESNEDLEDLLEDLDPDFMVNEHQLIK